MAEDPERQVAEIFPTLVADLQRGDVARFDEQQKAERVAREALRRENQPGLTASELMKKIDGDPADDIRRIQDELTKINKDAAAAVSKVKKEEPLPSGFFPPPPRSG